MSSRILYRLSAGTLIIGGLLLLISSIMGAILFPDNSSAPEQVLSLPWNLVTLIFLLGSLLCSIGLPALYLRQSTQVGVMGFVGFILLFISFVLNFAFSSVQLVALPLLAQTAPHLLVGQEIPLGMSAFLFLLIAGLMQLVGGILLGIATLRAAVFPRLAGILLIVSGVLFVPLFLTSPSTLADILEVASFATLTGAFLWCGYSLMGRKYGTQEAAPFATAEARTSR